ncbi:hypothetical protein Hanom_Chr01g00082391 [Helianthus anomalus]
MSGLRALIYKLTAWVSLNVTLFNNESKAVFNSCNIPVCCSEAISSGGSSNNASENLGNSIFPIRKGLEPLESLSGPEKDPKELPDD